MDGKNKWFVKPDREADAHPCEIYDAETDRYYYDPKKKKSRYSPQITIKCDITPAPTEKYAEIIRDILREDYPDFEMPNSDVPIGVQMSVYPAHFYAGGLQPYVIGESIIEWEKWLYSALKGLVWHSEKQICVSGTEMRHRSYNGIRISIFLIYTQAQKKDNER